MNGKLVCVLAIFAIVAAMTFCETDACRRCGYDSCNHCQAPSYISVPSPIHSYPTCYGCGEQCSAPSCLPRPYCGGCLRRKTIRLNTNCDCCC